MQWDNVTNLKIVDLVDFEAQPFKVVDDEAVSLLVDSIMLILWWQTLKIRVKKLQNKMYFR